MVIILPFCLFLAFFPFNVNGHDRVIIPTKSGFVFYYDSNFIMLAKPPPLAFRKVTFLYNVHFSSLMYVTSKFLAQLKSRKLPWVVIAVIKFSSSQVICIYGDLSPGAEHQALGPSSRANAGAWLVLNSDDDVILLSGILLSCIPNSLPHSSA